MRRIVIQQQRELGPFAVVQPDLDELVRDDAAIADLDEDGLE